MTVTPIPATAASFAKNTSIDLPRRLGVASLVLIVVAFNAPLATMAGFSQLSIGFGNGIGAPTSFLLAGAILLIFSVGFVSMSRFIDDPGAFYRFIVVGLGKPPALAGAFLATAAYILLCAGSYPYLGLVAVQFAKQFTGREILSWQSWTACFLVAITMLGLLRIDLSVRVLGALVCVEIAVVAIWEAAIFLHGGPEGYSLASYTPAAFGQGQPGLGILFAMLCMIGIESAACFRAETKDPERAVGQATYIAILFMAVFYSMGTWAYIISQGASHAVHNAATEPVASFFQSVDAYLGPLFVRLVSLVVVTSQIVAINAIQGAASRYLFALGRDRILPASLGLVHRKLESPFVAVLCVSLISAIILAAIFWFDVDPVMAYGGLTGTGIYFLLPLLVLTSVSVVMFFRAHRTLKANRWSSFVFPSLSGVALAGLFALTTANLRLLVGSEAVASFALSGVVLLTLAGVTLALFYRRFSPDRYALI